MAENLPHDKIIMHDLLEGVVPYELELLLAHYKYFTVAQLNARISNYKATLGSMDDLQRRISGNSITKLTTISPLPDASMGSRVFVLNPTALPSSEPHILDWAL